MNHTQAYPQHKFSKSLDTFTCSCGNWAIANATELSARRNHRLHLEALPPERLGNPVHTRSRAWFVPNAYPVDLWEQDRPNPAHDPLDHPDPLRAIPGLCPAARRGIEAAVLHLGTATVEGLLKTVTFRTASFEPRPTRTNWIDL